MVFRREAGRGLDRRRRAGGRGREAIARAGSCRWAIVELAVLLTVAWSGTALGQKDSLDIGGMTFVSSRDSVNEFVLWSETAHYFTDTQTAELEQVHVNVIPAEHRLGLELRCQRGRINLATNDFRLEGEIHGRTSEGLKFEAEWIGYDDSGGVFYSDAPVLIRDAGGTYRGGGFRYDMREDRFRLLAGSSVVRGR